MTLKPTDYALLAKDVYKDHVANQRVVLDDVSYDVIAVSEPSKLGFQAAAYRRVDSFEVVIAYRGTEFDREPVKDGAIDAVMVVAGINIQQSQSEDFTKRALNKAFAEAQANHRPFNVTVTGHSLGGSLAELNAHRFSLSGETFNSYGTVGLSGIRQGGSTSVINHVRAGDPVSAASDHFGTVRTYATAGDVESLTHAGYDSPLLSTHLRAVRAIDFSSHAIENFVPQNTVLGRSIIDPENEARYRANHVMVDNYRHDVFELRKQASTTWETRNAVFDAVDHGAHAAGATAMNAGRAVSGAAGAGAREVQHYAAEKHQQFNNGLEAIGNAAARTAHDVGTGAAVAFTAAPVAETLNGSRYGSPALDRIIDPPHLDRPENPDHALFQQARAAVHRLDAETGRKPDNVSENLAGALTVEARRSGLTRIDHVALSGDASRAYAMQGDFNSPFKKVAEVQTELGIATSIEKSSAALRDVEVQQLAQPQPDATQNTITQSQAGPAPRM